MIELPSVTMKEIEHVLPSSLFQVTVPDKLDRKRSPRHSRKSPIAIDSDSSVVAFLGRHLQRPLPSPPTPSPPTPKGDFPKSLSRTVRNPR